MSLLFRLTDKDGDGALNVNEWLGVARLMGLDDRQFMRLVRSPTIPYGQIEYTEFDKAMRNMFTLGKLKGDGPKDLLGSLEWAVGELTKEPHRGICIVSWKGGPPQLVASKLTTAIESWDCYDADFSSAEFVSSTSEKTPGGGDSITIPAYVQVHGLNALSPANPTNERKWSVLQKQLADATAQIVGVHDVQITDAHY